MKKQVNCLIKLSLFIISVILPILSFAANGDNRYPLVLTPPDTDVSMQYLANIFGVVDGVLHGGGSQIMGQIFGVFNAGALVLGGIIIIYFTLVSTLNTAHEGEFLGKRWRSIWIPIRAVTGIALLLPKATGYSALQVFVMWIAVQGVGLADSVWNAALNYIQGGGVVVQQALGADPNINAATGRALKSEVCLFALQEVLQKGAEKARAKGEKVPTIPLITTNIIPIPDKPICVPGGGPCVPLPDFRNADPSLQKLTGICGRMAWNEIDADILAKNTGLSGATLRNLALSRQIAVQQMLVDLSSAGQIVARNWLQLDTTTPVSRVDDLLPIQLLNNTSRDYQGIEAPAIRSLATGNSKQDKSILESAKNKGWISAGSYFSNIAGLNKQIQNVIRKAPDVDKDGAIDKLKTSLPTALPTFVTDNVPDAITKIITIFAAEGGSSLNYYINTAEKAADTSGHQEGRVSPKDSFSFMGDGGIIKDAMKLFFGFITPLVSVFDTFDDLLHAQLNGANPLVLISLMGNNMTAFVTQFWIQSSIAIGGLALGTAFFCGMSVTTAIQTLVTHLFSFLWPILGICFLNGLVMTYYIPLIPFILFLFGVMGWFVAVIEAMVAAPIVALGIAYPEGQHELFGRSEQGIMLILNVFLTPALMIVGFIVGIILSSVVIWLLNFGFEATFASIPHASTTNDIFLYLFTQLARVVIYTILATYIIHESFTPIYRLRDQTMNFIGGPGSTLGGEFHKAATGAQSDVKGGAQALSEVANPGKTQQQGGDKGAGGRSEGKLSPGNTASQAQLEGSAKDTSQPGPKS